MLVYLQERRKIEDVNDSITPNSYSIIPVDLQYGNRLKATEKMYMDIAIQEINIFLNYMIVMLEQLLAG